MNKNLLVITGTQRSGTSFMASFFKECGYELGTDFWDVRINGGLESPDICNFYRNYLQDPRFPFDGYWDMIERETFYPLQKLHEHFDVVKFSYLLANPIFVEYWLNIRRGFNDTFLIMDRPLEDVMRSRATKPELDDEDSCIIPRSYLQLKLNWNRSYNKINGNNMGHFMIPFPSNDAKQVVKTIKSRTDIDLPDNAEEIYNTLYNPSKVQFK
jgi:hypothetical protein